MMRKKGGGKKGSFKKIRGGTQSRVSLANLRGKEGALTLIENS